tara:strand:- start:311 stop:1222 length:912 start_codon:yes stop_codon:yes gene_type:complete
MTFLISCNEKKCGFQSELNLKDGKYYCGRKLFSGYVKDYQSGNYMLENDYGKGDLIRSENYSLYYLDKFSTSYDYKFKNSSYYLNNNLKSTIEKSVFRFVYPNFFKPLPNKDEDGNTYVDNFPNGLNISSLLNTNFDVKGTNKSILGSLESSQIFFRDSSIIYREKFYKNLVMNNSILKKQIEVFEVVGGEVNLSNDYSSYVQMGWIDNFDPSEFIILEYNVNKRDQETLMMDSINNTYTTIYSDIVCRNKILHRCMVKQGNDSEINTNIRHEIPVSKQYYKFTRNNISLISPQGVGEDWGLN